MKSTLSELVGPSGLILIAAILGAIGAFWAGVQRAQSSRDLKKKNDEITELNRKIANLVTGGDSFSYFQIADLEPGSSAGYLMAVHQGEYPIYEVKARIVDLQKMEQKKGANFTIQSVLADDIHIPIGNMPAGAASMLGPFNLGTGEKRDFNIFFSARTGFHTQLLRMRRIDGIWRQATCVRVKDGTTEKIAFEKIDPEFPADAIDWKKGP